MRMCKLNQLLGTSTVNTRTEQFSLNGRHKHISVYPHVARKCCNISKLSVQKLQHVVVIKIPDFVRLVSLALPAAVCASLQFYCFQFTTRETACQYRRFLFLWLYLHQIRNSFVCDKWSGAFFLQHSDTKMQHTAVQLCDSKGHQ